MIDDQLVEMEESELPAGLLDARDLPAVSLSAYLAQRRWEIPPKAMITGARTKANEDPAAVKRWKGADGSFVALDAVALIALADAAEAYVQPCFDAEADIRTKIDDGEI